MSDYRELDWEMFTGHMFSRKELDEIYEQGRADEQLASIEDAKEQAHECIMAIDKARTDERARVLGEAKTRIEQGLENSSLPPNVVAHFKVFISNVFQELKEESDAM